MVPNVMKLSVSILFRFFLSTFFLVTSTAKAKIIRVPQDQPTIQAGIDAAVDGDTVLVDTGTYVQSNISFNENRILVGSRFVTTGDTSFISQTIIDGDGTGHVIYFNGNEDSTSVLSGFTITNGSAFGQEKPYGGGIVCNSSSPKIVFCKIVQNEATHGGGIYIESGKPILRDLIITDNYVSGGSGGGVYCVNANPTFERCLITHNTSRPNAVDAGGPGGGISCLDSNPIFLDVKISDNESLVYGWGMGGESTFSTHPQNSRGRP